MYPDKALSRLLYSDQPEPERFNRMNHLDAVIGEELKDRFFAEPLYSDRIVLHFGPMYNFSRLPVDFLAALRSKKELLLPNLSLKLVHEGENLLLFRVLRH